MGKPLYNKFDKDTLKQIVAKEEVPRVTLSFYQYAKIDNPELFRNHLYQLLENEAVLGRIYVAHEGINAQISVPEANLDSFKKQLFQIDFLDGIRLNIAVEHNQFSFLKLKIKVRNKIVADGLNDDTFDATNKGVHLKAEEFNKLTEDPNTILVDMRNHYESEIGHFQNAITPDVDTFREALTVVEEQLKDQKDKNLVMYCTGGIRCEKASAYYKHKGFKNVYQLEGGIIEYARRVNELGLDNKYIGKNFVFDDRRAEPISPAVISHCHQCDAPFDVHTNCVNDACHLLFIQCDSCRDKNKGCCSDECIEFVQLPKELQTEFKRGKDMGIQTFKKGRESVFVEKYRQWREENIAKILPHISA